jgi:hypothetical protein
MQESNHIQLFDIKPIMFNVEKVIQQGLNKLLVNYIDRHEMLEKTHKQLIQLPSIAQEINNRKNQTEINHTDSETDIDNCDSSDFNIIKDITENIIRDQFFQLENKLNKMEKKYDEIIPILDKLLTKITNLNDDTKEIQNNKNDCEQKIIANNVEKSSLVMSGKNENIEIHIQETEQLEKEEESDDEDVNPLLITCSKISLKEEENVDEELSVEQELGIEEMKLEEVKCSYEKENVEECPQEMEEEDEEIEGEEIEEEEIEEEEINVEINEEGKVKGSVQESLQEEEQEDASSVESETNEEVEEDASVETETKEEDTETNEEEEEEDIFEIEIDDKTYCTNNDENGFIWELNEEGEQGDKVGYLKDGEPFFYADEN